MKALVHLCRSMYVESVSKLRNTTGASVGTLADENCDWDTVSRLCLQSPARLNCTTESQLTSKPVHVSVLQYTALRYSVNERKQTFRWIWSNFTVSDECSPFFFLLHLTQRILCGKSKEVI